MSMLQARAASSATEPGGAERDEHVHVEARAEPRRPNGSDGSGKPWWNGEGKRQERLRAEHGTILVKALAAFPPKRPVTLTGWVLGGSGRRAADERTVASFDALDLALDRTWIPTTSSMDPASVLMPGHLRRTR